MAKNIYVGNLVWDATQDDLYNLFQEHGKVTRAQVIMDRETGRSRGFGFVEMENDGEADTAVNALNGADFRGRPLTVNEAKPREDRGGGGGGGGDALSAGLVAVAADLVAPAAAGMAAARIVAAVTNNDFENEPASLGAGSLCFQALARLTPLRVP